MTAVPRPLPSLDRIGARHVSYVRSVLGRLRVQPRHEREDLVQEVLLEAHRSRDTCLEPCALLLGIAHHVVFRWSLESRDAAHAVADYFQAYGEQCTQTSLEEDFQAAERVQFVRGSIAEIPAVFRDVFVRVDIDGQRVTEVAGETGIPVGTAYARLHLGRDRFEESIRRQMARRRLGKGDL